MTEQEIRETFFRTRDAAAALRARTQRVDRLVTEYWRASLERVAPPGIALAAVGGYGRGELFPFSDIDLLILVPDEKTPAAIKEPLSIFLRDLWDQNLRISQSVHTPVDCNQIDANNAELAVSLLDRRYLAGDEALFRQIRDPKPELGKNIATLTRERHAQFQNTIYHLEPNVKDAPGGLRDLQVLRWLARLGAGDSDAAGGVPVLFEVRCFLHYLAGRDDNKLTFERQDEIAGLMEAASPEALMRLYYRAVRGIARLADRRLDRFEAKRSSLFSQFRDRTGRLSNADFSVLHGQVFLRSSTALESRPELLLGLFDFVGRHGLPLAPDTEERVERALDGFRLWLREHSHVWPVFRAIARQPHAAKALRALHDTGVLTAIFPEMEEIEALVVRDFYHRYTVDEHTMVTIETVLGLRDRPGDQFGDLAAETQDLDLLATALLFHDVGKGDPEHGHVAVSNQIAQEALTRCGIGEAEWETISFLILAHLELSAAMNGRDLKDPSTARDVATRTGTVERLKLLTLLTYGDISAVHPTAMTPWRRQLLWNLYTATYAELTRELAEHVNAKSGIENAGGMSAEMRHFLEGLPPRYLRTHSESEMAEQLRLARECTRVTKEGKLVGAAVSLKRKEEWALTVVAEDRPFLFASIAAAISSFGFNILKAEAFSNAHGQAIDTFTFADPARMLELNPDEGALVTRTVLRTIAGEISVDQLLARRPKVKPDARMLAAARVGFDNEASATATLVELVTQDRPGLLYDVASLISRHGGNIEVVLVDTEAKKAIDVFYITRSGNKLNHDEATALTEELREIARAG